MSSSREELIQFLQDNQQSLKTDRFFKDNYKPKNLPNSWQEFKALDVSLAVPKSFYVAKKVNALSPTVKTIHEHLQKADREILEILNSQKVQELQLSDEAKNKIRRDYIFAAQAKIQPKTAPEGVAIQVIYANYLKNPEQELDPRIVARKIIFDKDKCRVFASKLNEYIGKRNQGSTYHHEGLHSFFKSIGLASEQKFSKTDKVNAATKLKNLVEGKVKDDNGQPVTKLTQDEVAILRNSDLGKLLRKYEHQGFTLSEHIEKQPAAVPRAAV